MEERTDLSSARGVTNKWKNEGICQNGDKARFNRLRKQKFRRGELIGDKEQHITDALHPAYWGDYAVIDSGLYLVDSEAKPRPTIMYYDFQTRRLTPVLIPKQNFPYWSPSFAASRDGRTMLFVQHENKSSIIMVEYLQ